MHPVSAQHSGRLVNNLHHRPRARQDKDQIALHTIDTPISLAVFEFASQYTNCSGFRSRRCASTNSPNRPRVAATRRRGLHRRITGEMNPAAEASHVNKSSPAFRYDTLQIRVPMCRSRLPDAENIPGSPLPIPINVVLLEPHCPGQGAVVAWKQRLSTSASRSDAVQCTCKQDNR